MRRGEIEGGRRSLWWYHRQRSLRSDDQINADSVLLLPIHVLQHSLFVCCFVSMYVCPVFVSQGDDRVRCVTTHRSPSRLETGEPGPGSGVADFTSVRERRKGSSTNLLRPTNTAQCVWWDWGMGRGLYPSHPDRYSLPVTLLPPSDHNFQSTCR